MSPNIPLTSMAIAQDSTLASSLHAWILNILVYGIYTAVFCVALYLTRMASVLSSFLKFTISVSFSRNR